jgi:hypothetical protein
MYQTVFDTVGREPIDGLDAVAQLPSTGRRIGTAAQQWLFYGLCLIIAAALVAQFALPLAILNRPISLNNNEGWNAYWTARAMAGQPLYTDAASPITNNYPPLSFYIVGLLARLFGDPIVIGRLLCLAGLIGITVMIERIIARFHGDRRWGIAAAAIFLLIIAAGAPRYLASDDPQWLAEAPMVASLLLLIGRKPSLPSRRRIVAACLLMLASGLIKHNQIALPIATTLWLALYDRRSLATWLLTATVASGVTVGVLTLLYGSPLFEEVLHHARLIDPALIGDALRSLSLQLPELLLAGLLAWSRPRDPRIALLLLFAPLAILIGIGERLGIGVSQNAHFDSAISLSILAGIALSRGTAPLRPTALRLVALLVMIVPLAIKVAHRAPDNFRQLASIGQTERQWREAIALLAAQPGPVGCERTALCYWSGKPYALDVFNYGQKLRLGNDPIRLRSQLANRKLAALVEVRDDQYGEDEAHLPLDVSRSITTNYRVARILPDNLYVWLPKP